MHLTITSSAKNAAPYVERCLRSVREQTHKDWTHYYVVDQGSTDGTLEKAQMAAGDDRDLRDWNYMLGLYKRGVDRNPGEPRMHLLKGRTPPGPLDTTLENLLPIWRDLPPEEVIVWLDGDDQLMPWALKYVVDAHERGAWATWGQFVTSKGETGFAAPVGPCPRREPWHATHLKTFRAGLVQKIDPEHLKDGFARDMAVMFPVVEMAAERGVFIPRILYLYNVENSFLRNAPEAEQRAELEAVKRIRGYPRYARLERL